MNHILDAFNSRCHGGCHSMIEDASPSYYQDSDEEEEGESSTPVKRPKNNLKFTTSPNLFRDHKSIYSMGNLTCKVKIGFLNEKGIFFVYHNNKNDKFQGRKIWYSTDGKQVFEKAKMLMKNMPITYQQLENIRGTIIETSKKYIQGRKKKTFTSFNFRNEQ